MIATPRVLMLGWEYPPYLAGGLGAACYGLVNALKEYASVTLIIPSFSEAYVEKQFEIIGLNRFEKEYLEDKAGTELALTSYTIDVQLDFHPYPVGIAFEVNEQVLHEQEPDEALFQTQEPYGPQIMAKVARFREMVLDLAEGLEYDLIHAHDWITYPAAVALQERTGKPLVAQVHSLETDRIGEMQDFSLNAVYEIERKTMLAADRVVPVSHYTKECIIKNYGIDGGKITPVYNATEQVEPYRIEKKTGDKLVLFLGRITFQKGPEFMVETAFKLTSRQPNVRFVVVGTGDKLASLKAMVLERGLEKNFIFTGFLPKRAVREVLAQTDVYFMPSVSEPFGLSALEAAQFEIPCIVSTQSGVSEVLPNSLQADFWDTDRFANYIFALLNYEGIRRDMVENTNQDLQQLSWDESARDVMEIYYSLLNA